MEITAYCSQCDRFRIQDNPSNDWACEGCEKKLLSFASNAFLNDKTLEQCPVCGAEHLYRQKDFNRKLGISLLVLGVLGAYFTYGISLVVVTLIDFFLYRMVGEVTCCYQCGSQFRKSEKIEAVPPFNLVLHDHYQNRPTNDKI